MFVRLVHHLYLIGDQGPKVLKLQYARDLLEKFSPKLHSETDALSDGLSVMFKVFVEFNNFPYVSGLASACSVGLGCFLFHDRFNGEGIEEYVVFFLKIRFLLIGFH